MRSAIPGIKERSTEKERNDSGEVEKPCRVMERESISHLGRRNWGGNEGGGGIWRWIWGGYGLVGPLLLRSASPR